MCDDVKFENVVKLTNLYNKLIKAYAEYKLLKDIYFHQLDELNTDELNYHIDMCFSEKHKNTDNTL